jgi:hypothetical protein
VNDDAAFTEFCAVYDGVDITPAVDNPMFKAGFTLDLDPAVCTGKGPERQAVEFDPQFSGDVQESAPTPICAPSLTGLGCRVTHQNHLRNHRYCMIAWERSGAASSNARQAFGSNPGKAAHIVLPECKDRNPWTGKDDQKGDEYQGFLATAYWLHPNGDDASDGLSKEIHLRKYMVFPHAAIPYSCSLARVGCTGGLTVFIYYFMCFCRCEAGVLSLIPSTKSSSPAPPGGSKSLFSALRTGKSTRPSSATRACGTPLSR